MLSQQNTSGGLNSVDHRFLTSLNWRCIGPPRGGRVVAVSGHPTKAPVFYFGAAGVHDGQCAVGPT